MEINFFVKMFFQLYFEDKTEMSDITAEKKLEAVSSEQAKNVERDEKKTPPKVDMISLLEEGDSDSEEVPCTKSKSKKKKEKSFPTCCVCKEFPYNPQSLLCGHSLCIVCYETMILKTPDFIKCPLCNKLVDTSEVVPNFALRETLQLCWESEYKVRELLDQENAQKRKVRIELNKFLDDNIICISRGREKNPALLLKILEVLKKNPDKSKYPDNLLSLLQTNNKKALYIGNYTRNENVYQSKDTYYSIFGERYALFVF